MFSIASRGDTALTLLLNFIDSSTKQHARLGALYTIHLIGINRTIKGRFNEEFTNAKAREALYGCLRYPEFHKSIASLLKRDRWFSDVPILIHYLGIYRNSWPLTNLLKIYGMNEFPLQQNLPERYNSM